VEKQDLAVAVAVSLLEIAVKDRIARQSDTIQITFFHKCDSCDSKKAHFGGGNHAFRCTVRQNRADSAVHEMENFKKQASQLWSRRDAKSRMHRNETVCLISIKFCATVEIPEIMTHANCGGDR